MVLDIQPWRLTFHSPEGSTRSADQTTIVMDPFVRWTSLLRTGFGQLPPNGVLFDAHFPSTDSGLLGHAHLDHVLDAPHFYASTGALFVGGETAANVARAAERHGDSPRPAMR